MREVRRLRLGCFEGEKVLGKRRRIGPEEEKDEEEDDKILEC